MTVASTLCEKFSHSKKRLAVEGLLCQHSEYFRSDVLQCQLSQWDSTQKAETQILKTKQNKRQKQIQDYGTSSSELEQLKLDIEISCVLCIIIL